MPNYILSCTSTVDLSKEHLEQRNISYIRFHFNLNGVDYEDDLGQSIPFKEFYSRMAKGEMTKTSQPAIGDYEAYFKDLVAINKNIVHIALSSGLSGDFNAANLAAKHIMEEDKGVKIIVLDSLAASSGYGLLVDAAADERDGGLSMDELAKWVEENKLRVHHWFFSTDLKYYVRGGRVSPGAGLIGNLLHICPLLNVSNEGKLVVRAKVHGVKTVEKEIVERMKEFVDDGFDYSGKVFL
ncbi:MAG: DegV family protein, partial [Bacilli bacterium]|nr:DegV family protein [Bacilli bacterium]